MADYQLNYTGAQIDSAIGKALGIGAVTISIPASGWANQSQTVNCAIATASNSLTISPVSWTDAENWRDGELWATAQGNGTITFRCGTTTPTADISVNVKAQ